jgi:hypothetical protein
MSLMNKGTHAHTCTHTHTYTLFLIMHFTYLSHTHTHTHTLACCAAKPDSARAAPASQKHMHCNHMHLIPCNATFTPWQFALQSPIPAALQGSGAARGRSASRLLGERRGVTCQHPGISRPAVVAVLACTHGCQKAGGQNTAVTYMAGR